MTDKFPSGTYHILGREPKRLRRAIRTPPVTEMRAAVEGLEEAALFRGLFARVLGGPRHGTQVSSLARREESADVGELSLKSVLQTQSAESGGVSDIVCLLSGRYNPADSVAKIKEARPVPFRPDDSVGAPATKSAAHLIEEGVSDYGCGWAKLVVGAACPSLIRIVFLGPPLLFP